MCTILLAWRCPGFAPVMLAANRDELVARPSAPPRLVAEPRIFAGRDLLAGGTWLAVAQDGRLAAVTNRRVGTEGLVERDPGRRSRGEIPLALLRGGDEPAIPQRLAALGPGVYNPVNVLYASTRFAVVAHVDDSGPPRIHQLDPGPHVITVFDLDDVARPKVAALRGAFAAALAAAGDTDGLRAGTVLVLASHRTPTGDPLDAPCIHGDVYGTVSASTVVIDEVSVDYRHAQGRPCVTAFEAVLSVPTAC